MTQITHSKSGTTLAQIGYTVDSVGNPLTMTDSVGTSSYDYDANNRLVSAAIPSPVPGQPAGGPYGYDWVGNRIHPPTGSNAMIYNKADQLTSWPGIRSWLSIRQRREPHAGKQLYGTKIAGYHYSPAQLLDSAGFIDTGGNNVSLTNIWDADSNRVSFTGATAHNLRLRHHSGNSCRRGGLDRYQCSVLHPRTERLAHLACLGSSLWYYHFDELGSTRLITDSGGNVTDKLRLRRLRRVPLARVG